MGKRITYKCDGENCGNTSNIENGPDVFPEGWYAKVSHMGRTVEFLCPDCYKKMCQTDNGFLGGD